MATNPLAALKASVRGQLTTRDDKDAFAAARFRGWNRDLNVRANPLGFVVVSGVRDIVTAVNYCRSNSIPIASPLRVRSLGGPRSAARAWSDVVSAGIVDIDIGFGRDEGSS